jgi:CRP-like cAMP-binding protein
MWEGEPGDCVIILRTGQVKIASRAGDGNERLLGVRGPGELLGEMSCMDAKPRSASVIAHSKVQVIKIAAGRFIDFLSRHPVVSRKVTCQVITRLRSAERRHAALASYEVQPRLVQELGEMTRVFADRRGPAGIEIPLSQNELAQLINAAQVSTNRALSLLRRRRFVRTEYRRVIVPCESCLERLRKEDGKGLTGCGGTESCTPG